MGDCDHIRLEDVSMFFGRREVFSGLSCCFPRGDISVILGGSGSGKSTVLKLIGGLVRPRSGLVWVDDNDITHLSERDLYKIRRKVGMMFQGGALLDSLTVYENLAFPLREHTKLDEGEIADRVRKCLDSVGLNDVEDLLPGQLSGGMTKRVALGRALMMEPVILLCDEPFSGLDPISIRRIEELLTRINEEYSITILVVSHHIASTMRMAQQILLLLPGGAIEGTPQELLAQDDPRVRAFLQEDFREHVDMSIGSVEGSHEDKEWSRSW
jgi:phospholipid/cholesterol/gamma-HCH transport system ATP-binding protein